jgi:hypothetical protein
MFVRCRNRIVSGSKRPSAFHLSELKRPMTRFLFLVSALIFLSACAPKHYSALDTQDALNRFQSHFNASHPDHPISGEFLEMGVQFGTGQGWDMNSQAGIAKLEQELKVMAEDSGASSRWLFRGTFHVAGPTSAFTQTVYGLAMLSQTNSEVNIICDSKNAGIRFTGVSTGGRLSGAMVISTGAVVCKARAEGSIVPRRISLDTQGENASELIRGSFVFLR